MSKKDFQLVKNFNKTNHSDSVFNIHEIFAEEIGQEFNTVYMFKVNDNDKVVEFVNNLNSKILKDCEFRIKSVHKHKTITKLNILDLDPELYLNEDEDNVDMYSSEFFYIFDNFIIHLETNMKAWLHLDFYYKEETPLIVSLRQQIAETIPIGRSKGKRSFSIITTDKRGSYSLKDIKLDEVNETDFFNHYNHDLKEISKVVEDKLNNDSKGIVLLHGEAGTGKTTYLRYLIRNIVHKKVIYLPPDLSKALSQPDFITFLMDHRNAIIFIEDAENVLKEREANDSQAVSNILNLSDGILGDALKFQIVATFNTGLEFIDKALTRPGRLIAEYRFDKLGIDKSNILLNKLYSNNITTDIPLTLAEIFNYNNKQYKSLNNKIKPGIY